MQDNRNNSLKIILMSASLSEDIYCEYFKDVNDGKNPPIIRINESINKISEYSLNIIIEDIVKDEMLPKYLKQEIVNNKLLYNKMKVETPIFLNKLFPIVASIIKQV